MCVMRILAVGPSPIYLWKKQSKKHACENDTMLSQRQGADIILACNVRAVSSFAGLGSIAERTLLPRLGTKSQ